jgi:muconate cycloisomerase
MIIRSLTAYHVCLPLKRPFAHASHVRHVSENVLVRCELTDGTTGWGEGVPRDYVTGETPEGVLAQFEATPIGEQLGGGFDSWPGVIALCERFQPAAVENDPRGSVGNSLRAAVEIAILDAFGRAVGEPVRRVVEHFEPAAPIRVSLDHVCYSTAIGSSRGERLRLKALKMRAYGFRQCKVKVGAAGADDVRRLATIRRWIGPRVDIRIDANEAWSVGEVVAKLATLKPAGITAIEQPCPHDELIQLARVRPTLGVPVMLDESLTTLADAGRAIELRACDLFNLRLSKCGGFLNCLRLAAMAHDAGLGYQLGCHPGESGILSAAGRHWATSVADIRYWEGSYDRHLFHQLLTNEDITFGYGGRAPALTGAGLGVTVNEQVLRNVTRREVHCELAREVRP